MSQPQVSRTGSTGTPATSEPATRPDPQVVPKAQRRRFSAKYKQRILTEADKCTERGQIGALLRREGLYGSHLEKWRQQRDQAAREAFAAQKRGRKVDPQAAEIERLRQENERLQTRLQQAETIIEVQKKVAALFGLAPSTATPSEEC